MSGFEEANMRLLVALGGQVLEIIDTLFNKAPLELRKKKEKKNMYEEATSTCMEA